MDELALAWLANRDEMEHVSPVRGWLLWASICCCSRRSNITVPAGSDISSVLMNGEFVVLLEGVP